MDNRKRGIFFAHEAFKKSKQEMDSSGTAIKTMPCTKFFSMAGCAFGENCHFLHKVPGGYNAVAQMMNLEPAPAQRSVTSPTNPNGSITSPSMKKRMCNKYNTAEGCKFGEKCHFAHGEWELGKLAIPMVQDDPRGMGPGLYAGRADPPAAAPVAEFGASATAKISIDASLVGPIIGKGGVNSKVICRQTGVKLSIRDHESDTNLRNVELEGTFDQIKEASTLVKELIVSISSMLPPSKEQGRSNYKKKLCENFPKGSCRFGDVCHFAHAASELRKPGI